MRTRDSKTRPREGRRAVPAAVWILPLSGAMLLGLQISGCSPANSTRLPELATLPRGLLSKEEQKKVVDDLQQRRSTHRDEAIKEIKSARRR